MEFYTVLIKKYLGGLHDVLFPAICAVWSPLVSLDGATLVPGAVQ